jgi:hypothetical protein
MSLTVSSKTKSETKARTSKRRTAKKAKISEDEIRVLAYNLYERRRVDGLEGDATSDWVEAEQRLLKQTQHQSQPQ